MKNINNMNKRAQSGYSTIFIYRLVMIMVLLIGVVATVGTIYGQSIDLRKIEAQQINNKVISCIDQQKNQVLVKELIETCVNYNEGELSTKITYADKKIILGKELINTLCESEDKTKSKVSCYTNNYLILKDNKFEKITILTGISKVNKNA
ncbi:hypothetical protein J4465_00790 [Candidatus Pacearchaeota archaeon]|nr:hypothetical protein [Candidatus Pacearchaeota archaeon]